MAALAYWFRLGSPPHVRGKVPYVSMAALAQGITPAYAGKSESYGLPALPRWDHPRVCGEETHGTRGLARPSGSPPRMRGRGMYAMHPARAWGITPAYAGKRPAAWAGAWRTGDHPRVCGEKVVLSIFLVPLMGSPPRVRGKVTSLIPALPLHGITPACAGKSFRSNAVGTLDRDHPRVCGEKGSFPKNVYSGEGSPPRVRGKVRCFCRSSSDSGITPACAGKRAMDALPSFPAGDHPRVCGEKAPRHLALCCILGSPPRVRGKARHLVRGAVKRGITPACAGKREPPPAFRACGRDHPRVCGEKRAARRAAAGRAGSPPRVRGKVCAQGAQI